jgi:hypothetical protein
LRDLRDEIPCAAEQGINSTTTGNSIPANRELIRDNRELAKIDPLAAIKRLFRAAALAGDRSKLNFVIPLTVDFAPADSSLAICRREAYKRRHRAREEPK